MKIRVAQVRWINVYLILLLTRGKMTFTFKVQIILRSFSKRVSNKNRVHLKEQEFVERYNPLENLRK